MPRSGPNTGNITERELAFLFLDYIGLEREHLQKAVRELVSALDAHETKFFTDKGIVTDERDVIAWAPRIKAAQQLLDRFPLRLGGDDVKKTLKVEVEVKRVDEHRVVDVTPRALDDEAAESESATRSTPT